MSARILVVEDNARNAKLARAVLEMAGMEVELATTGAEALDRAREVQPDIVLLDIQLPDVDGFAVLERLRSTDTTASIPVVALTSFAMADDRERCLQAGFDDYLTKPIDVATFAGTIRAILERPDVRT